MRPVGVGDAGCVQGIWCLAHPDDKSRSFMVMIAVDDIEGGAGIVQEYMRTGVDQDAPPRQEAHPPPPPRAVPKRRAVDDFGEI